MIVISFGAFITWETPTIVLAGLYIVDRTENISVKLSALFFRSIFMLYYKSEITAFVK